MGRDPISKEDVIESFVRSSGPGGQNVNKVATCVVLLHKPTGTIIKCRQFRTQLLNRRHAWAMLRESLGQKEEQARLFRLARQEKIRRQNRKPTLSSKERTLQDKKKHRLKKVNRKKIQDWEG